MPASWVANRDAVLGQNRVVNEQAEVRVRELASGEIREGEVTKNVDNEFGGDRGGDACCRGTRMEPKIFVASGSIHVGSRRRLGP